MAAKDAVALDVGARHVAVAPDHAHFWTQGVGEAPQGPAGALAPRRSSAGFRHLLFSADERHDHETLNLADIERLDALRDKNKTPRHRAPGLLVLGLGEGHGDAGRPAVALLRAELRGLRGDGGWFRASGGRRGPDALHDGADGAGRVPLVRVDFLEQGVVVCVETKFQAPHAVDATLSP